MQREDCRQLPILHHQMGKLCSGKGGNATRGLPQDEILVNLPIPPGQCVSALVAQNLAEGVTRSSICINVLRRTACVPVMIISSVVMLQTRALTKACQTDHRRPNCCRKTVGFVGCSRSSPIPHPATRGSRKAACIVPASYNLSSSLSGPN
jgi:hypothetical protein